MTPSTFTFQTERPFFGRNQIQIWAFTTEEAEALLKTNTGMEFPEAVLIKVERA